MTQGQGHLHPTVQEYVANRELAVTYDTYFAATPLFRYDCRFIADYAKPPGPALDLGCGTGRHLVYLETSGIKSFGIDLNPHMLEEGLRKRVNGQRLRLIQADFHALPLNPGVKFQCILMMFSTLGLVWPARRRTQLLRSLHPYLAPDGFLIFHVHNRLYLDTPTVGGVTGLWRDLREWFAGREQGDRIISHYRGVLDLYLHCFDRQEIEALLRRSGYRAVEIRPLNDRRDGPYQGPDPDRFANGFLVAAQLDASKRQPLPS